MEGERILKSLLNGETDGLYDDTKNYLSPLQSSLNNKNSCKAGTKATEETIPKYTVFCAKFLRCAVETLKKVKAKGNSLDEITSSLNLVGTLLNNTLCSHNGNYLKFIPSLDQLGKTIYLIVVQLIGKGEFDRALGHASDLLKFIQLLKAWKNYDSEKMDKELASLALRVSDVLLQGAGKLEEIKITPAQRTTHLCVVLEWRRFSILFQTEAILHSSLKSIVDRTLKCGTKYQMDSGQKNVNFKSLAGFFKSIFDALLSRTEQLISVGKDSLLLLVELGFHFGRICSKGGSSTQALAVFDKLLELSGNTGHCKNGHTKLQLPLLVCCCVCLVCKAAISLLCGNAKSQTQDTCQQLLFESQRILSQILRCKMLPSPMLKLLTDALEYFRIILQNVCNKQTDTTKEKIPYLSWRVFQGTEQLLQSYIAVLSLQCERLKAELKRVSSDDSVAQLRQQLQKTTDRQLGVLSFLISSYQDQLKSDKDAKNCSKESRNHILKHCPTVAQEASTLIHSALDDPDIPVSPNELRWLGCNVYNLGCVSYQRDCFAEGVPLLTMACEELRVWCSAAEKEVDILSRMEEVKLFTKFALLTDCQRRAGQLRDALKTATSQVFISVRTSCDAVIIRQMIKQWTTVKHELVKSLQDEEKEVERSRTLCSALAEQEDAENIVGHQLCFVLQEELRCYKVKSYDTSVEQIAVVKQLMELYIVQEDEFHYGSSMLELAVSLHSFGDPGLEEERSALDYCQEAVAILEQFVDKVASTGEDNTFYSSVVQDRVAAAYLWQALLEHKVTIEEKQTGQSPGLCEDFEIDELEGICLEQGFVSSLYSALEMWTILVNRSVQKEPNGKIDLQHFSNPEESCHYLLITAGMFGVLNQPIKKVCALHLAGIISQAIGTVCMLENAVSAFSDAVHTMCDLLDIDHASVLLHNAGEMLDTFESSAATKVLFLLAKSHYLLITGKYSEGEDCLQEVLQSDVHTHKSYKTHLLKANLKSLCAKYSMVPAKQHVFTLSLDPVLGSMTALECAMDGFQKLSHMAEEVFGEDVFNSSKKKNQQKENAPGEGSLIMSSNKQSLFLFSLLDALLSSLLHVGQLYACQGAVREAFRQFVDGVALASHFALSYRIAEFLVNISQLELRQGKTDKCQNRLEQLKGILKPVLESSGEAELYEEGTEEPLFIRHPESCECVSCDDPALHVILVNYFMSLSKYLSSVSRQEQGVYILDMTETVCECTQKKIVKSLGRLDAILHVHCTGAVELKVKDSRKKGRAKGKKQKVDTAVKNVTPQLMFSHHQVSLYCMKAQLMLQSGTVEKANNELSKAKEILQCVENVVGNDPVFLLTEKATLLYLSGVAAMMSNSGCSGKVHIDYNWFTKHPTEVSGEGTTVVMDSVKGDSTENEIEKQRTGSTRRGRGSKPAENTHVKDDSKPKSTTAKGRGRRKKVEETEGECDKSDADLQQKTKGRKKPAKATRTRKDVPDNKAAPEWVSKAIHNWNEAFDLCQAFPPPALFSDICLGLALCHGRSAPQLSMYYLNLCSSLTLRHQALTSTGKRIKRTAKEVSVSSSGAAECSKDINHLVEGLFSLSLDSDISSEISLKTACKLKEYVKIRNLMKFNLLSGRSAESSSYLFSHEEMGLLQKIPKEWTVCTLETFKQPGSEETELIICRIRAGAEPVLVKINTTKGEEQIKENESKDVVMDLTKLFECSLMEEFNDLMSANVKSMSVDNTSEWWAQRTRLNTKMMTFLEKLEASWLGRWKGILLGQPVGKGCEDSVMKIARKLQQRIMCMCGCEPDVQMLEVLVSSSSHLSRKEINDAFAEITGTDPTSPSLSQLLHEFEDLTDGLFSCGDKGHAQHRNGSSSEMLSRHPVILILGKDIQHLPWESIPMLYDHPVTRVPSLQFLLSKVTCQMQLTRVDPVKTFYALNPQNNLPNTQKMFQKWFESEHGWQGITGKAPTKEEFSKALTDHEMFIYFGHGTGREFLQGHDIQRLDCQAVTLLMGCSSGKLMVGGECEPRGMVLNYLLAGCPAIVANLWDVTDKDIDRFSESLLKQWLDPDTYLSLPEVLSQSRRACKLKYLIGASPVLYGLPVHIKT